MLGDLTHLVKQDKFLESTRACAELAFSRSYKFFALGYNGLCWSEPNARQQYYIKGSTKETNCPNGIGKEKRIAVFTFGKFTLRNMSCNTSYYILGSVVMRWKNSTNGKIVLKHLTINWIDFERQELYWH